jgi:hypothetical protein
VLRKCGMWLWCLRMGGWSGRLVIAFEEDIQSCALKSCNLSLLFVPPPLLVRYIWLCSHAVSAVVKPLSTRVWVRDALKDLLAALDLDVRVNRMVYVGELLTGGCIQLPIIGREVKD